MRLRRREFLGSAPLMMSGAAAIAKGAAREVVPLNFPTGRAFPYRTKPFDEVTLTDRFWATRVATNRNVTIPFELSKADAPDAYLASGIVEASIFSLQTGDDPRLKAAVDRRIDGMLKRPTRVRNQYFEIAASQFKATGDRRLLNQSIAQADALAREFREKDPPFTGSERDALNCVQLYRVTGNPRHLALAQHYLDIRGQPDSLGRSRHNQSYMPVTEQREAVGHAVNAVTLMLSLVDVGVLTGDQRYFEAGHAMWSDAVARKLYITGGVGTTGNEGFGKPYVLPQLSAYAETCAVLMFQTLSHRLFLATGDSRYIDVMERGLYNNAIDGVSVSGDHFFYVNRLASAGDGRDARWQHASLECCPPNLVRFMASMPGLIWAEGPKDAVHLNLYVANEASFRLAGGTLALKVESDMPWGGDSAVNVTSGTPVRAALRLRIPGWARGVPAPGGLYSYADNPSGTLHVGLNGADLGAVPDALGYVEIDRTWQKGDTVKISLPMMARRVIADPQVHECAGRVAIERGPVVYCAEWPEAPDGKALDLVLRADAPLKPRTDAKLLGGAVVIDTAASRASDPLGKVKPLTLIPYHLWANRGVGEMTTWLMTRGYKPGDVGPAGGLIFYVNPNAEKDGWRYLEAAPFDQSGGAIWGRFRHKIDGAMSTKIGAGATNTAEMLRGGVEPGSAAQLCASFKLSGIGGWFLPSTEELIEMYKALRATGIGDFRDAGLADNCQYWASSQHDADMAAHVDFADNGRLHGDDKDFPRRVRAARMI